MARRHLYDGLFEEDEREQFEDQYEEEQYEDNPFDENQFKKWFEEERAKTASKFSEAREVMTKKYDDKQKRLIRIHKKWRIANWAVVIFLATQAFGSLLSILRISRTFRPMLIFFVGCVSFASIMIAFANGTSHDRFRRKSGQIIAIVSECIMLLPVLIDTIKISGMGIANYVASKLGWEACNVENYKDSSLSVIWMLNLILAGGVCYSLLKEEQSTDDRLRSVRTPQKRDITDLETITDENGKKKLRIEKYKQ